MPKGKPQLNKAVGRVYNLRQIFKRLNGLYFNGQVKARLEWGKSRGQKSRRSREFGSYYYKERLIRAHPVLDQAWVPLFVVESVMHHEMCHQVCPDEVKNGRRIAHTKEFRRREKEYVHYQEADRWMHKNLKKLMSEAPSLEKAKSSKPPKQLGLSFAA